MRKIRGATIGAIAFSWLAPAARAEMARHIELQAIDAGMTSPEGYYRWMDTADQLYEQAYRDNYRYTQASVAIDFFSETTPLRGTLTASGLKPNFAYQLKLVGLPESEPAANERVGLTGRWWQEEWDGTKWAGGSNLNNKGDGSSPNPNDVTYYARRDIPDPTSPTGKNYRYTAYLVMDYFITGEEGNASLSFRADSSYHVLWKTSQLSPAAGDGPLKAATFDPDPASPAYDVDYGPKTVEIFGEWERLPTGGVTLPFGRYRVMFMLTEESFHGGGLAGGWAAAMGTTAEFTIVSTPADLDCDGDVDGNDLGLFRNCTTGSSVGPPGPGCESADFDRDGDADQSDFGVFQRCTSGENNPADPNCAN